MMDLGLFDGQRFELIEGELIDKRGQNPPHAQTILLLNEFLANVYGTRRVRVQAPVQVGAQDRELNLPEPDLAVTREYKPEYRRRHPAGDELLLAVEVADTSVRTDTRTKRSLYARAGIPEYWVLDIPGRRLFVHRQPVDGVYRDVREVDSNGIIAPESMPGESIAVGAPLL